MNEQGGHSDEEIRSLVKDELNSKLKELGLSNLPVRVSSEPPTKGEVEESGAVLEKLATIKGVYVWLWKKAGKPIAILLTVLAVARFVGEIILPGTVPDADDLAHKIRSGAIEVAQHVSADLRDEPEQFIVFSPSWAVLEDAQYLDLRDHYLYGYELSTEQTPELEELQDTMLVAVSAVPEDILARSSSSSSSSSGIGPSEMT